MNGNTDIDIVLTWVDGNDPVWRASKAEWLRRESVERWSAWTSGDKRFRDWGLLKYWFRGVEAFAPWVHKVHFVTFGHVPKWLNTEHPKLEIVKHEDFIPHEYLPTFNSHTIELNLHRIEGLSERFIYFNDDMYIVRPVSGEAFFLDGLPRDFGALSVCYLNRERTSYDIYDAMIINSHFRIDEVIRRDRAKWFNPVYGARTNLKNLSLSKCSRFPGFQGDHLALKLLKSTYEHLWSSEKSELDAVCRKRFRGFYGISPWVVRNWQRAEGNFIPMKPDYEGFIDQLVLANRGNQKKVEDVILGGKHDVICVNDECSDEDYAFWRDVTTNSFESLLPNRSNFEVSIDD